MVDLWGQVGDDDAAFYPGDGSGFDTIVTYQGTEGRCQFTHDWVEIEDGGDVVSTRAPQAMIAAATFPGIAISDQVTVNGVLYIVRDIRPDDTDRLLILSLP